MRTYSIILSGMLLSLMLASCQKFVDIKKSSGQTYLSTAADCQLMLDDYNTMNTGYPLDGEISSDDYYVAGVNWPNITQEEKALYTWSAAAQRTSAAPNWQNPYRVVYNANLVLQELDKLKGSNEDPALLNTLRGSALFYRAYCFWNVAQLYTKPYDAATAGQNPGIPLRLDPDVNGKSVRGTVQDTYNQILKDLNEAVSLLPNTSSIATRPNKRAAYAMLARVYLSMGDYPNALTSASAAIQINGTLLDYNNTDLVMAFSDRPFQRFNPEVIFHAISYYQGFTPTIGTILGFGFGGYGNTAKIDPALVASYNADDLRSTVFLKENYNDDDGTPNGTYRFSGNYEPGFFATLFTGLATDELYLIRAECYARAGNTGGAVQDLKTLLSKRWKTGVDPNVSASSPDDALAKVLTERRKELLMRGLRWTDLRRLKKSISRTVTESGTSTTYTLPAGDARYTLLIPKEVIEKSGLAQNQR